MCNNNSYVVVIEYYSKELSSSKIIFAGYRLPDIIFSYNGAQFFTIKFKTFCKDWDINYSMSSPYYAQYNGFAKRTNKIHQRNVQ